MCVCVCVCVCVCARARACTCVSRYSQVHTGNYVRNTKCVQDQEGRGGRGIGRNGPKGRNQKSKIPSRGKSMPVYYCQLLQALKRECLGFSTEGYLISVSAITNYGVALVAGKPENCLRNVQSKLYLKRP